MITVLKFKNMTNFPSLNVLLKMHFTKRKKIKESLIWDVRTQTKNKHLGTVKITYERLGVRLLDWDNYASSFKMIGDALHGTDVIVDDNPNVVVKFVPKQTKVERKRNEIIIITIEDYGNI